VTHPVEVEIPHARPLSTPPQDAIAAVLETTGDVTLAFIIAVKGPSYRPVGAAMALFPDGSRIGSLSSGCVEGDLAAHAQRILTGAPEVIRYGEGSPYFDIQLPCGGGMEVLLVRSPDRAALQEVHRRRGRREACVLRIDLQSGAMEVGASDPAARASLGVDGAQFSVLFEPEIRFVIFGKGPEATSFAKLVASVGFPNLLLSPDLETLDAVAAMGCSVQHLTHAAFPHTLAVDERTAITLFFHDHDWEPPVLKGALGTRAFYIGAQGSQRARDARALALSNLGVSQAAIARIHGPIGLIPSARDATTLAVSVLAEVLATAMPPKG
jgi:xanthine dehydrogenase accessory factor